MSVHVRLTQLDGKLPNLALMRLAAHHRAEGHEIHFSRSPFRDMLEPQSYDRVYGSAIFNFTAERVAKLRANFPEAIVGGTWNTADKVTVEQAVGASAREMDYSMYPNFDASIGFASRGCRLKCGFCAVPKLEGKPFAANAISEIWRGPGHAKHLHLLDNDFFGHGMWPQHIDDIRSGGFRVCFNQGINIRMVTPEVAAALKSVPYYDDQFKVRRLYTAWDNIGDESRFFRGVDMLAEAGIPPAHLMAYMLIGYDPRETWERIFYRFNRMIALGIRPYPMIWGDRHRRVPLGGTNRRLERRTLSEFQRWVIRKSYHAVEFEDYDVNAKGRIGGSLPELLPL